MNPKTIEAGTGRMQGARDTVLKLAWIGVVLLLVAEVALVAWVNVTYSKYGRSVPYETKLFWARALMGAAMAVPCVALVGFLFSLARPRRIVAGLGVLVASVVLSLAVISINAWA